MMKISAIIVTIGVKDYLRRCLDSVSGKILRSDGKTLDSTGLFLSIWRTAEATPRIIFSWISNRKQRFFGDD